MPRLRTLSRTPPGLIRAEIERRKAHDRAKGPEYARCAADPAHFTDRHCVIDDAQGHGDGGGTMPFRLWAAQREALAALHAGRRVVILKARQLGISWLCCAYALWLCLFHPGKVVLLFSKGQLEANELIRRVRALYDRLPGWLRAACPLGRPPNTRAIHWANGSRIESMPATPTAGSSYTASLVIMDEAAKMAHAEALYASAKPTIDAGGQLIVLSTAFGVGNLFHRLWTRAVAGLNGFTVVFLPWHARPGRDDAWHARQVAEANDPSACLQEYPADPTEAFIASGRPRFPAAWLHAQGPNARERGLPDPALPARLRGVPGLVAYAPPAAAAGRPVLIGADVAEGLEGGDYSAAVVLDADSLEELASLHGRWEPDEYGDLLAALGDAYGGRVVVERNNHGHAVLSRLRAVRPAVGAAWTIADGPDGRPGWLTTTTTKPQAIDRLAELLRDGGVTVRSRPTLDELQVYSVGSGGRTGAPQGFHDDRVMAWAAAVGWQALCRPAPAARVGAGGTLPPPPRPFIPGAPSGVPRPFHPTGRTF
jgi:hypothetical protein